MRELVYFAIIASLVATAPVAVFGQSPPGATIESKTAAFDVDGSPLGLQNGSAFFEARISANDSALMVSSVIVEASSGSTHNITGVSVYPSKDSEPIAYSGPIDLQWQSSNQGAAMASAGPFPVSIPEGGVLGVRFGTSGLGGGDQVRVTFVYLAEPENAAATATVPVAMVELNPLEITTISAIARSPGFAVDEAFSDPEAHCELCAKIVYNPEWQGTGEAAYVTEEMHLQGVSEVQFWARGEQGGETWTFKAAGKRGPDGAVAYANTTQATLGQEWEMYEIAIPSPSPPNAADLTSVTHLFAFEPSAGGNQTIYLKGIAYH